MKLYILVVFCCISSIVLAQQSPMYFTNKHNTDTSYFLKNREYNYLALYIDGFSDTITSEKMVIKPLASAWGAQPLLQQAVRYLYFTDTSDYKNFIHPIKYFHARNQKKYMKKGLFPISAKETTGAIYNDSIFYMHPPRSNQYSMLFYSVHLKVNLNYLTDTITRFNNGLSIPAMGDFHWATEVCPMVDTLMYGKTIKAWSLRTTSTGNIKEKYKNEGIYNSTLESVFCREYGFTKLHYTFENNIKIQFDLLDIVTIDIQ